MIDSIVFLLLFSVPFLDMFVELLDEISRCSSGPFSLIGLDSSEENREHDGTVDEREAKTNLSNHFDVRAWSLERVWHEHQTYAKAGHEASTFTSHRDRDPCDSCIAES